MTPLKHLIYVPEGASDDPYNYSGTPLYLGRALEKACQKHGICFSVIDFPEIINTEPLYAIATAAAQSRDMLDDLWTKLPKKQQASNIAQELHSDLSQTPSNIALAVERYTNRLRKITKCRLQSVITSQSSLLALNTLNPPLADSAYYFLDTPLVPFYFDKTLGLVPNRGDAPALQAFFEEQESHAIHSSCGLFFFSQFALDLCENHYDGSTARSEVVGAGINFEQWPDVLARKVDESNVLRVLFVGRDFDIKGGPLILEAASQLTPDLFRFTLVTESRFHQDATELIRFIEPVGKETLEKMYLSHDVFIFPSERDAFGLVVCEAMAYGLPVISTPIRALPEIIGPASTVWNPFITNAGTLAKRLQQLASSSELRRSIGQRNHLVASLRFRWNVVVERMLLKMISNKETEECHTLVTNRI